jgi:hypothetical protein
MWICGKLKRDSNSHVEVFTSSTQHVAIFGNKSFRKVSPNPDKKRKFGCIERYQRCS